MPLSGPETIDCNEFLKNKNSSGSLEACKKLAATLKDTSCVIIRDPRVSEADNNAFLTMMENYYDQPTDEKMKDVHEELSYQLGATPEFVEVPRDNLEVIKKLSEKTENAPHIPKGADPKWRYFWRIGERPSSTQFPELNAPPVIPRNFPQWSEVMNKWGFLMMQSIETVAEMVAIGLNLPPNTFLDLMHQGPHLLAPTGSDLGKFNNLEQIFAGFHYDLNFLTIHGKSRFPGLFIWLRDGTKVPVRVPDGCLLIQAGKQIEWLTGGEITAGFHEVVVAPETLVSLGKATNEHRSLWRVSSTLFSHIASDKYLKPLAHFKTEKSEKIYPNILAGNQVEEELNMIKLGVDGQQK